MWEPAEYAKLPRWDRDTPFQPGGTFMCHQADGRMCAGWIGCHGPSRLLGVRLAFYRGDLDQAELDATLDYVCPVELFGSGQEAADHGIAEVEYPGPEAGKIIGKFVRRKGGPASS